MYTNVTDPWSIFAFVCPRQALQMALLLLWNMILHMVRGLKMHFYAFYVIFY